jgi:hypothetical protein
MISFLLAATLNLPISPDPKLTPGSVFPNVSLKTLCTVGYTKTVRDVPQSVKKKVFALYKIDPKSDKFEVDHLISLQLGGNNDVKNLWPQSYTTLPLNAHRKDVLENKLRRLMCKKIITIKQAQQEISVDWVKSYKKYIVTPTKPNI